MFLALSIAASHVTHRCVQRVSGEGEGWMVEKETWGQGGVLLGSAVDRNLGSEDWGEKKYFKKEEPMASCHLIGLINLTV